MKDFLNILKTLERRKILYINSFIILSITLFILLAQFSDSKVRDYQNSIVLSQNQANNLMINQIAWILNGNFQQTNWLHGYTPDLSAVQLEREHADSRFVALTQKLSIGQITARDYMRESSQIYLLGSKEYSDLYNQKATEINEKFRKGTNWSLISNIINSLLLILTLISGFLNVLLVYKESKNENSRNAAASGAV